MHSLLSMFDSDKNEILAHAVESLDAASRAELVAWLSNRMEQSAAGVAELDPVGSLAGEVFLGDADEVDAILSALHRISPSVAWAAAAHWIVHGSDEQAQRAGPHLEQLKDNAGAWLPDHVDASTPDLLVQRTLCLHPDPQIRAEALECLLSRGGESVQLAVRRGVRDPDPRVGLCLDEVFARVHQGIDILILSELAHDESPEVSRWTFCALARTKTEVTLAWCEEVLSSEGESRELFDPGKPESFEAWEARLNACEALRNQAAHLLAFLASEYWPNPELRQPDWVQRGIDILEANLEEDVCDLDVARTALESLARIGAPSWRRHLSLLLESFRSEDRVEAIDIIHRHGDERDVPLLRTCLKDRDDDVRVAALRALVHKSDRRDFWYHALARMLRSRSDDVRTAALELLGDIGGPEDVDRALPQLTHSSQEVRAAALAALAKLAPDRIVEIAREKITDASEEVCQPALEILKEHLSREDLAREAVRSLDRAEGSSGAVLLTYAREEMPDKLSEILEAAAQSSSASARVECARMLGEQDRAFSEPLLRQLFRDRESVVRHHALESLLRLAPEQIRRLADRAFRDPSWSVRLKGVNAIGEVEDPSLVEDLLKLARDTDEDVRRTAIHVLAKFDDDRVFGELVSSLHDVDPTVQGAAKELLESSSSSVPVLARFASRSGRPVWERVQDQVAAINQWAADVGRELLGQPVHVVQYRQGIGRTRATRGSVTIEVSDAPVTSGHRHGANIMRGIALHEIGHHLYDIGVRGHRTNRGIAHAEGVGEIFEILLDERLERALRSRRPEWGVYFDRLASYAFSQQPHRVSVDELAKVLRRTPEDVSAAVTRKELPGRLVPPKHPGWPPHVELREIDSLAIPDLLPPQTAFLLCLRSRVDPRLHPNPAVARALAEIPSDLKDLPHSEVLQAARRISRHVGDLREHRRHMRRLRRRMRRFRAVMQSLNRVLSRLAEAGMLPSGNRSIPPDIRTNIPPRSVADSQQTLRDGLRPRSRGVRSINLSSKLDFSPLEHEVVLQPDATQHAEILASVRLHVRRLRGYLERLGTRWIDEHAARRGRRLDLARARAAIHTRSPNMLIFTKEVQQPNAYMGILIDRSGSMTGNEIGLAKSFATLLAESARGLRGIDGHINAFDHNTFYRLGDFQRHAVGALSAGGGNNDAGGLQRAADLALRSGRRNKLLIMVSDGSPTACSVESLKALVHALHRDYQISCVQVGVSAIDHVAFPRFVDVSSYSFDEAVARFGNLLVSLTAKWE